MPFTTNSNHVQARVRRFGVFPYKVLADVAHIKSTGELVVLTAKPLSKHPDAQGITWHCSNPACQHRVWESESELEAHHGDPAKYASSQQAHTYYAFGFLPEIKAQ